MNAEPSRKSRGRFKRHVNIWRNIEGLNFRLLAVFSKSFVSDRG